MNILYAIILGFVQGATEFLPISSSGHLVLAERLLGLKDVSLAFDVALHLGTLMAILVYFRNDFYLMSRALLFGKLPGGDEVFYRKLAVYIVIATIPGVLAGLFIGGYAETYLRRPLLVASTLGGVALFLLWAERVGKKRRDFHKLGLGDAVVVGLAQAMAIVPGVSRSGVTMTAGLFLGLDRPTTARFSFMMAAPIIFGAGVYKIPEILHEGGQGGQFAFYLAGFLSSTVFGYIFVAWLIKFIRARTFDIFAYYRLGLAALIYLLVLLN
ncbi:MAG: undecaprenyl-diphosphatase UppP [Desulfurivibrionaceae bacterium]|nr:undecaprenyl-diphosphatase UppP [Desulfobulbales bacterium]MDT8334142.1 undecaprenyl-diphosphatase UppP [Desulfurivibrionaceae bacterium]